MPTLGIAAKMPENGYLLQELQFEKSVSMKESEARQLRSAIGGMINVHAPYYGTLAAGKEQKVKDTMMRVAESIRIARVMRSKIVVVRAGFYAKNSPEDAYEIVRDNCKELVRGMGLMRLGIETLGRQSQFGTVDEVMQLADDVPGVVPVFNLANIHARTGGGLRTKADFSEIFSLVEEPYCHVSGVRLGGSPEANYCALEDSGFRFKNMAEAASGFKSLSVICDGPEAKRDFELLSRLFPS